LGSTVQVSSVFERSYGKTPVSIRESLRGTMPVGHE
jgi:hypothetical protein